ncbi:MAG: DUF2851 family protein [Bacteroidales bacterium]|nr:DUF2851 family protein [Bacteroidales bacterium]
MNIPKTVPEEFLCFIWENRLFSTDKLKTIDNESIEVVHAGRRNSHSGPDFFNAKIKIGETLWAGNIEIHKKASDWERHNHSGDRAYENVILHVVEQADRQIRRENGTKIATLEMKWPEQLSKNYQKLLDAKTWIACQEQFHLVNPTMLQLGFHRLMVERLEEKTDEIIGILEKNQQNWNETFYQILARMFGFKVNAIPFELLAKAIPLKILGKHKNSLHQLESLLFGSSGLLSEELFGDSYFTGLRNEFDFLQKKYKLNIVEPHLWKHMRMRPGNFPAIRISQFAALIYRSSSLFSKILKTESVEEIRNLFNVKASEYWDSHYRFNKPSAKVYPKRLGVSAINTLIINVVVPFLFVYGENQNQHYLKDRALDFLEKLPPENNSITDKWKKLGVEPKSAFDSQALLQLKTRHCAQKRCLNCPVGVKLVKRIE